MTEKHPYQTKIHFATGGSITPEKVEFRTMCGRKFKQGHSEIMDSGAWGATRVTCKACRHKLDEQEKWSKHIDAVMRLVNTGKFDKLAIK